MTHNLRVHIFLYTVFELDKPLFSVSPALKKICKEVHFKEFDFNFQRHSDLLLKEDILTITFTDV